MYFLRLGAAFLVAALMVQCQSSTAVPADSNTWHIVVAPLPVGTLSPSAFDIIFDPVTGNATLPALAWNNDRETFDSTPQIVMTRDTLRATVFVTGPNPDNCNSLVIWALLNPSGDSATGTLALENGSGNPTLPCFEHTSVVAVKR